MSLLSIRRSMSQQVEHQKKVHIKFSGASISTVNRAAGRGACVPSAEDKDGCYFGSNCVFDTSLIMQYQIMSVGMQMYMYTYILSGD